VGVALCREFPLKLHREFPFRDSCGRNTRVAVYRGALYRELAVLLCIPRSSKWSSVLILTIALSNTKNVEISFQDGSSNLTNKNINLYVWPTTKISGH
jgi:hypothetical protein